MKTKLINEEVMNQIYEDLINGKRGDALAAEYEKQINSLERALSILDEHEDLMYASLLLEVERDQLIKELHGGEVL